MTSQNQITVLEEGRIDGEVGISTTHLVDPECAGMTELPDASATRARVAEILQRSRETYQNQRMVDSTEPDIALRNLVPTDPLFVHLSNGLAYTTGSALGCIPPSVESCLQAYQISNKAGLTAGSKAWSKHAHRSIASPELAQPAMTVHLDSTSQTKKRNPGEGWWGRPSGPVATINEKSLAIFWKIMDGATWRNLHWLPHEILVYEVRVKDGYGMRWAQDMSGGRLNEPWIFRGFLEPQMEGGHDVGWRHPISPS